MLVAPLATLLIMVPSLFAAKVTHTSVPATISKLIPGLLIRPHEVSQSAVGGRSAGSHPSAGAGRANPRPVPSPQVPGGRPELALAEPLLAAAPAGPTLPSVPAAPTTPSAPVSGGPALAVAKTPIQTTKPKNHGKHRGHKARDDQDRDKPQDKGRG